MYVEELRLGDVISARGVMGYRHFGIIVGWQSPHGYVVVHNAKGQGVICGWLRLFLQAGDVRLEKRAKEGKAREIVESALALRGADYYLLNFNCEHFVNFVHGEPVVSRQLQRTVWATLAAAAAAALYTRNRPQYDHYARRYRTRSGRFASRPFFGRYK